MSARCPICHEEQGDCECKGQVPPARRLRRNTDPATSHDAAEKIVGRLGAIQAHVIAAIDRHPRHTANELAELENQRDPRTFNRRITELHRAGLIVVVEERDCTVTGANARTWKLAPKEGLF